MYFEAHKVCHILMSSSQKIFLTTKILWVFVLTIRAAKVSLETRLSQSVPRHSSFFSHYNIQKKRKPCLFKLPFALFLLPKWINKEQCLGQITAQVTSAKNGTHNLNVKLLCHSLGKWWLEQWARTHIFIPLYADTRSPRNEGTT